MPGAYHHSVAEYIQLMKFKNAAQAAAAGDSADAEGDSKKGADAGGSASAGAACKQAAKKEEEGGVTISQSFSILGLHT